MLCWIRLGADQSLLIVSFWYIFAQEHACGLLNIVSRINLFVAVVNGHFCSLIGWNPLILRWGLSTCAWRISVFILSFCECGAGMLGLLLVT